MEMHERLKLARQNAGFATAKLAAERLGVPYGTYSGHESGNRGVKREDLKHYAKAYGVSVSWLTYGIKKEMWSVTSPAIFMGRIEYSDGIIQPINNSDRLEKQIFIHPLPLLNVRQAAIEVRNNTLSGFAPINSIVYIEIVDDDQKYSDILSFEGRACLLDLQVDGKISSLIGTPYVQRDGGFRVERFLLPAIQSADVQAAMPVIGIILGSYKDVLFDTTDIELTSSESPGS